MLGVGRQVVRVPCDDDRQRRLAPPRVRDADQRHLGDLGVRGQDVLDLGAVDVLAAGDDHVLLAVDDVEVAVLVLAHQVAGVEPAARGTPPRSPRACSSTPSSPSGCGRRSRRPRPCGDVVHLLVDDPDLDVEHRRTDRADLADRVLAAQAGGDRAALGLPERRTTSACGKASIIVRSSVVEAGAAPQEMRRRRERSRVGDVGHGAPSPAHWPAPGRCWRRRSRSIEVARWRPGRSRPTAVITMRAAREQRRQHPGQPGDVEQRRRRTARPGRRRVDAEVRHLAEGVQVAGCGG